MKYDTIDFKIQAAGTLKDLHWEDCDRCIIFVNGQDILDIVREKEKKFFVRAKLDVNGAGEYHYMDPDKLYVYLAYAGLSCGDTKAPILCCTCDDVGCSSVRVEVHHLMNEVVWKNFESCRKSWKFGLTYKFEPKAYKDFMDRLKNRQKNDNEYKAIPDKP